MAFDINSWKNDLDGRFAAWRDRMKQLGRKSIYGFVSATALWPVVEAVRSGDWAGAGGALTSLVGAKGAELLQKKIGQWTSEEDASAQLDKAIETDTELRDELDKVLKELQALKVARATLPEDEHLWFDKTLEKELQKLGSTQSFSAVVHGSGAIAQGKGAIAVGAGGVVATGGSSIKIGRGNKSEDE